MQKRYYEDPTLDPKVQVVGNYGWHEAFPYEQYLLNYGGSKPLLDSTKGKIALDFGCGPGRMVKRMSKFFKRVDGADISQRLLDLAKLECPESDFYVTDGSDLGNAPSNTYDFIYSTISMQHIASFSVRQAIFKSMFCALKPGGCITIQMGYNPNYYSHEHARWSEDKFDAKGTNSVCDVIINEADLGTVPECFELLGYEDFAWWLCSVHDKYDNLNGQIHPKDYWPSHWIFLNAWRRND
jgi:SAM-dependent methyltransferase